MLKKYLIYILFQSNILILLAPTSSYGVFNFVSTGIEELNVDGTEIKINQSRSEYCIQKANEGKYVLCFPHAEMYITQRGETNDITHILKEWDGFFVFFVKIRTNQYAVDLNSDGKKEIAIVPQVSGGGAISLPAYLYTITDHGLAPYGEGRFFWENGQKVLLGCPQCSKFNLGACNSCY